MHHLRFVACLLSYTLAYDSAQKPSNFFYRVSPAGAPLKIEPIWYAPKPKYPSQATKAEAIAVALADFKSKRGSKIDGHPVYGDLRHYSLVLQRQGNRLHIVFMPEDVPLKSNEATTGGSTKYGWAVDYYIFLSTLKITDLHYER